MAILDLIERKIDVLDVSISVLAIIITAIVGRIFYMQVLHPLSKFPGPWYATSFSVVGAILSVKQKEPEFLLYLVEKYGTDRPIRISPTELLFPRPSALKDIYWDPQCNQKGGLYGTGTLGPPHLVTTIGGDQHRRLRRALSNAPWTIGQLRSKWESRFDDHVNLFIEKMHEHAAAKRTICLSDKVAEFATDIMSMVSFTEPFGCVKNQRDERSVLLNWRQGLPLFGFAARFRFFRERILTIPKIGLWFLPALSSNTGMGWLINEADRQVSAREKKIASGFSLDKPDFLQHCLDARFSDGSPLTPVQKRAHVTLLIQAGADTTATALGSTLRFLVTHPSALSRARAEIDSAVESGLLSSPIQYEETRQHLPFFIACIKESLRLHPPAPNLLARITPKGGKVIDGHFIPGGTEITSHSYTIHRNKTLYGADVEEYKPERWMISEKRTFELEAAQFGFGTGSRVCLGKDVAMLEMYKLLPEIIRRFDIELEQAGRYIVEGGVAYNKGFLGKLVARDQI